MKNTRPLSRSGYTISVDMIGNSKSIITQNSAVSKYELLISSLEWPNITDHLNEPWMRTINSNSRNITCKRCGTRSDSVDLCH